MVRLRGSMGSIRVSGGFPAVAGVIVAILCLGLCGCRTPKWRNPRQLGLRDQVLRVVRHLQSEEPALKEDRAALEAAYGAVEAAPPSYSEHYRVWHWRGDNWALEFDVRQPHGTRPPPLDENSALRVVRFRVEGSAPGESKGVFIYEDHKYLRRSGSTLVDALQMPGQSLHGRSGVRDVAQKAVETMVDFWQAPLEASVLVEQIGRNSGRVPPKETQSVSSELLQKYDQLPPRIQKLYEVSGAMAEDSETFRWRAGRLEAALDCAYIGGRMAQGQQGYYIHAILLKVYGETDTVLRSLRIQSNSMVQRNNGPTVLASGLAGGERAP